MTEPSTGGPRATLKRLLPLLRAKDLSRIAELYAEDGVHELPFAPPGAPRRLVGREQVRAYFTGPLATVPLTFHEFTEFAVHDTGDPQVIVAEYDAGGTADRSGTAFTVRFLWVLRVADGQILRWRDYFNPQEILALQGVGPRQESV